MTRDGFAANNRGIAAGGNLEESFLNEIFDHIQANPISLKEDDTARERAGEVSLLISLQYSRILADGHVLCASPSCAYVCVSVDHTCNMQYAVWIDPRGKIKL